MAKTDFKSIDEYHATFPDEIRERMETIRQLVREQVPEAEEVISYQIPAFKYSGFLIYYSAYKSHISLSYPFSDALLARFREELSKYKVSKSAIQLPFSEPLSIGFLKDLIRFRAAENKEAEAKKPAKPSKKKA